MSENTSNEVTLRKWTIRCSKFGIPYLTAHTVHNHPRIGTGYYGHSTSLIWVDPDRNLAQSLNTLYFLEEPDPDTKSPEVQELIAKLHPSNIPPEILKAHANRLPWPGTAFEDDVVAHWNIERWTSLRKGVDFLAD